MNTVSRENLPASVVHYDDWIGVQDAMSKQVITRDSYDWDIDNIRLVAGVDISFVPMSKEDACASLVVMSFPDLKVLHTSLEMVKLTLPYIPGFLAFREAPHIEMLLEKLRIAHPELWPQVLLVDGNGFGLACQIGVRSDLPTIGVGKTHFLLDGITAHQARVLADTLRHGGDSVELVGDSGRVWGALLRASEASTSALYVSIGHRISLSSAIELVHRCCQFRIPEPVRQADLLSRDYIRKHAMA